MSFRLTKPSLQTVVYYILGVILLAGFVALYWTRFTNTPMLPPLIRLIALHWGRYAVLVVNALVFLLFMVFLPYRGRVEWRSKGVLSGFVVALFAEMFGVPLLIYLLHPLLGYQLSISIPGIGEVKLFSHYLFFGWAGAVIGAYLTLLGMAIVFIGWVQVYRASGLVATGLYRYARHPQYVGIFFIITGWVFAWPTFLIFVLYPILLVMYYRLSKREERELGEKFPVAYAAYRARTRMFFPWPRRRARAAERSGESREDRTGTSFAIPGVPATLVAMSPLFPIPTRRTFSRYPDNRPAVLTSTEPGAVSESDVDRIASICSEPEVYRTLFEDMLGGRPYTREDAVRFARFAANGWESNQMFVFLVRDADDRVVAAIDIKTADLSSSEVGYWASVHHPGYMTNAVLALSDLAGEVGYKSLYARTRLDNLRSQAVLVRAGFESVGQWTDDRIGPFVRFEKSLSSFRPE